MGKSTDMYVLVIDMLVSRVSRLTNINIGSIPYTDMYMSVNDVRIFDLGGEVTTLYKNKKDKIRQVNRPHELGLKPEGVEKWEKIVVHKNSNKVNPKYPWLIPKFSDIVRGQRLKPERWQKLTIGEEITLAEREVLVEVLFNSEAGIVLDLCEQGYFRPEIEPPHTIPTADHTPWQAASFRVPKALENHITDFIKAKVDCGRWPEVVARIGPRGS